MPNRTGMGVEAPIGRTYEVEGRKLCLHTAGQGGPAVVFCPGAGLIGLDFLNIHEAVAAFTTSVVYDRGGTGWSDDVALPRTAAAVATELRALLQAAGIAPPYVLVGHSLGGAYVRRFAQLFPGEVAGLVMLDPADEGFLALPQPTLWQNLRMLLAVAPKLVRARSFYRPMFERMLAAWPDDLRRIAVAYHLANWSRSLLEAKTLHTEVLPEIAAGGPPSVPTVVLTPMGLDPFMTPFMRGAALRELNDRKRAFYDALARSAPQGENRLIPDAGHSTLHTDRPDAVVQAIRDVIAWAQAGAHAHAA